MAGLPGTGLGGVFYALLVVWMAVREACLSFRGTSSQARWRKILSLGLLLAGIMLALWLEGWLLQHLLGPLPGLSGQITAADGKTVALNALIPALAVAPFIILALLIVSMHIARLLLRTPGGSEGAVKAVELVLPELELTELDLPRNRAA
jgi:cytochrome bd-type quinol oxidase subunit 2